MPTMLDLVLRRMSRRARRCVIIGVSLVLVLTVCYLLLSQELRGVSPAASSADEVTIGFRAVHKAAPAFALPPLEGHGTVALHGLAGKPLVVNFWASDCTVCRQESPAIARVAREVGGRVRFLGIDTLDYHGPAVTFIRRYGISYPIAVDAHGTTAARYGVPGLPVTFFLSPTTRQIVGENIGALTSRSLTVILRRLYGVRA
jgi:cytochrome c biogenesis protein CcmG/thiol:disulfide interchange protein DsbE